jgi:alpha-tubulin suppressor-like RCC1 family protein
MFLPVLLAVTGLQAVAPIPFAGKVARNGVNHDGLLRFVFSLEDGNGTVLWRNGADANATIEVPVSRGRYIVLLGGQGMNPLPADLFHENAELSLRVRVDLQDGFGLLPLSPVHRVSSSPKALASELAKLAERAAVADAVAPGSVTLDNFSPAYRTQLNGLLAPSLSAYAVDGLTPKFPKARAAIPVPLGKPFVLQAPETPGKDLTYVWKRHGEVIEGADGPELSITGNEGEYSVTASNALGSAQTVFSTYGIKGGRFSIAGHSMWVDENGSLWGVGRNDYGQLGDETTVSRSNPVKVLDGGVVSVAVANKQSFFLKEDGSLWGMGYGWFGAIGAGTTQHQTSPVEIVTEGCVEVSLGTDHTLFLKSDGSLWVMGRNDYGQLGTGAPLDPDKHHAGTKELSPVEIVDGNVTNIAANGLSSLFLKSDGSLWGMGRNTEGQLGDGTTTSRNTPVEIVDGDVTGIACGESHALLVKTDGSAWAMGSDSQGRLGNGEDEDSLVPVRVVESGVIKVSAGFYNSYFLKSDGTLWGCGAQGDGQLGAEVNNAAKAPVKIAEGVEDVAAGAWSVLYSLNDGTLIGLGENKRAQLSTETPLHRASPTRIFESGVEQVIGCFSHNFFIRTGGALWATGENDNGRLGSNFDKGDRLLISPVEILEANVTRVSSYDGSTLFVKEDKTLWAMGWNAHGQLGTGSTDDQTTPVQIDANVTAVSSRYHSLYAKTDGSLWAMGRNDKGQLGDGNVTDRHTPVKIVDANVTAVATDWEFSLFLKTDGSVWSMGSSKAGQLGYGGLDDQITPVKVMGSGAVAIETGSNYGLIIRTDGSLWGFGGCWRGQLGEGNVSNRRTPIKIVDDGVVSVGAGQNHTLFVKTDGSLWGMGGNDFGQLGNEQADEFVFPVLILDSGAAKVSAAGNHSLVLMQDGSVLAFGSDQYGQLGLGRMVQTSTPYPVATGLAPTLVD